MKPKDLLTQESKVENVKNSDYNRLGGISFFEEGK